ncbi:MAG: AraC family transcriptional regulator [Spirochaetaceae bacterium]|nr:MAG: AraC family transcriptional regulator [Spirochaetaceae bacterium]
MRRFTCIDYPIPELPHITHLGYCDHQTDRRFGIHYHLGFELIFIKRGRAEVRVLPDRRPVHCFGDDLLVTSPRVEHELLIGDSEVEYYVIGVQTDALLGVSDDHIFAPHSLIQRSRNPVRYLEAEAKFKALEELGEALVVDRFVLISRAPEFLNPLQALYAEARLKLPWREYAVFGHLLLLLSMLQRRTEGTVRTTLRSRAVAYALEFIRAHAPEPVELNQVAGLTGLHPAHLSRMIRRETGHTFSEILLEERIRRAKNMLITGASVGSVAAASGFASIHSFSRAFSRVTGVSPSRYRGSVAVGSA